MAGVWMSAPPWYVIGGVTTPVPPVVSDVPTVGRLPRLVSGPLESLGEAASGSFSGFVRCLTGPWPCPLCACAVLSSCEARNRQTAARTAREMLKVLFILVSLRGYEVRARGAEPACSF